MVESPLKISDSWLSEKPRKLAPLWLELHGGLEMGKEVGNIQPMRDLSLMITVYSLLIFEKTIVRNILHGSSESLSKIKSHLPTVENNSINTQFHFHIRKQLNKMWSFAGGSAAMNPPASAGDEGEMRSIPGSGRYPGRGNGNPFPIFLLDTIK